MRRTITVCSVAWVLLAMGCRGQTRRQPPVHLNWNMDFQTRYELQEANPAFSDGRAMRSPVEGTVARGELHQNAAVDDGLDDFTGEFLNFIPLAVTPALVQRGQGRYAIYCSPCHDNAGTGRGVVSERGMAPPPNLHDERLRTMAVGQIYSTIKKGSPSGIMPSYAMQVPTRDRWAIVAFVRALQLSGHAPKSLVPPEVLKEKGWNE